MSAGGAPALFFDRDGTLNELVWQADHDEWGPPLRVADIALKPGAAAAVTSARRLGFKVFVVTNQPDAAKAKASLADIDVVQEAFLAALGPGALDGYERCLHHPDAVVAEYRSDCPCRKPRTGMIDTLVAAHDIDRSRSWMIWDRGSDILCGKAAGLGTIAVREPHTRHAASAEEPDFIADDLSGVIHILTEHRDRKRQ